MCGNAAHPVLTPARELFDAPSPCFVLDIDRLRANVNILGQVQEATGAKILLALKAFAAFDVFPMLSGAATGPLHGVCASSVDEARLGRELFGGEVHAFAAAWSEAEMADLVRYADHIVFNSASQLRKYAPMLAENGIEMGLRVNPEHSEGAAPIYDPCAPGSRLGVRKKAIGDIDSKEWESVAGLHFHTLCEQGADALERTLQAFERNFAPCIPGCKWLNFGGGHHITRPGYDLGLLQKLLVDWKKRYGCQIYLEPGEAVALNAGWLKATVLDIVEADLPVAILDTSAACHMPDVLEMPYTPAVWYMGANGPLQGAAGGRLPFTIQLAGKSCLAGDVIGTYSFTRPLAIGDGLLFADMAIYSMVKTTTFNGLRLPAIAAFDATAASPLRIIREFGYEDFKNRLS